jgi:hypothetical protein
VESVIYQKDSFWQFFPKKSNTICLSELCLREISGRKRRLIFMKITLISPKGPLYRHRGGIFKKNLRYAPLTLSTLAAYVPPELNAAIEIIDEGIEDVDLNLELRCAPTNSRLIFAGGAFLLCWADLMLR